MPLNRLVVINHYVSSFSFLSCFLTFVNKHWPSLQSLYERHLSFQQLVKYSDYFFHHPIVTWYVLFVFKLHCYLCVNSISYPFSIWISCFSFFFMFQIIYLYILMQLCSCIFGNIFQNMVCWSSSFFPQLMENMSKLKVLICTDYSFRPSKLYNYELLFHENWKESD